MAATETLIMGEPGTGKSTAARELDPAITAIVNPIGKPLPFPTKGKKFSMLSGVTDSREVVSWIKEQVKAGKKIIIVDDFQYFLSIPYMNRIHENGWDKWNDFGADYYSIIEVAKDLPVDVRMYFLTHTETLDNGITTIKLIGKMLREKISIEGLFTIVLKTSVIDGKYYFLTQNSGKDTVKSPMGMFPDYAITNDLKYVDDKICNYYEIGQFKSDEEMQEADKAAGDDSIEKPTAGRRARTSSQTERKKRTRAEVQEENNEKIAKYMEERDKAIDEIADGRDEVPWDETEEATKDIEAPTLEKLPRKTREEALKEIEEEEQETGAPDFSALNPPEKKPRGRKAREIEAKGNPEEVNETNETVSETNETAAETSRPARRSRRRV